MAMFVQSGGGRGGRRSRRRPMSEINVTPLVDVILVLLIIFMVTAPLLTTGVTVDLPQASAPNLSQPDDTALSVSVDAQGRVFVGTNAEPVEIDAMVGQLTAVLGANPESRIYVHGDTALQYGTVMEVLGRLFNAGYTKAALVTQPPVGGGR